MRKAISIVFLATLMFVLPSDRSAQAVPSPGDRIRIKQVDGTVLTGTLATWSEESIQLSVDSSRVEVPVARIEVLETSLGRQPQFGKYIGLTVAATSIVGATIGGIAWEPCTGSGICLGTHGEWILMGFGIGAVVGLPLGAIIGSLATEERWNPLALPAPAASRLTLRPVIGSGVGFTGSIRVGGF